MASYVLSGPKINVTLFVQDDPFDRIAVDDDFILSFVCTHTARKLRNWDTKIYSCQNFLTIKKAMFCVVVVANLFKLLARRKN